MSKARKGAEKVRRNSAQGHALVERWQRSGLTVSEFCRRQGGRPHVLRYWIARETEPSTSGTAASDFFVVSAPERQSRNGSIEGPRASEITETHAESAVIVVLSAASPGRLAQTVRALLQESGA